MLGQLTTTALPIGLKLLSPSNSQSAYVEAKQLSVSF